MTFAAAFEPIAVDAATVHTAPVADTDRLAGAPQTGSVDVARIAGAEVGIWEMSVGAMCDIEVDEVFVVISGRATVELVEGDGVTRTLELVPGTLCRLERGMHTRWHVTDVLRKVYIVADTETTP